MCGSEPMKGGGGGGFKALQVIISLPSDVVVINVLSVTLKFGQKVLLKRMFKSLVMLSFASHIFFKSFDKI